MANGKKPVKWDDVEKNPRIFVTPLLKKQLKKLAAKKGLHIYEASCLVVKAGLSAL